MGCGQSDANKPTVIIQVGYWNNRGAVQPVRFFAEHLGIQWENKTYAGVDWFGKDKCDFVAKGNCLANLPYVKDGETLVFESSALPVYLANKLNKTSSIARNIDDMIQIATVNGAVDDLRVATIMKVIFMMPNEEYLRTGKETFKASAEPHLRKLEYSLKEKQFILGDYLVYEDFCVFEITDMIRHYDIDLLRKYPNLKAHNDAIREIPAIKAYMKSPKFQVRPFFNPAYANWC